MKQVKKSSGGGHDKLSKKAENEKKLGLALNQKMTSITVKTVREGCHKINNVITLRGDGTRI